LVVNTRYTINTDRTLVLPSSPANGSVIELTISDGKSMFKLNNKARELLLSGKLHKATIHCCTELKKKPAWNTGKLPIRKGISQTKEHVEKRIKAHKGSIRTEESRQRMSEARKGKVPWNKGRARSEELNKKYKKPVLHIESGVIYPSINEAALAFKCSGQTISNQVKKGIFKAIQ
jgi:hypothetical protein